MADGEALAISIPSSEARVIQYFQERMPYGLFVPDVFSLRNSLTLKTRPMRVSRDPGAVRYWT
jgi:hypothetical protein